MDQLSDVTEEELLEQYDIGPLVVRQIRSAIARWQQRDDEAAGNDGWTRTVYNPSLTCFFRLSVLTLNCP